MLGSVQTAPVDEVVEVVETEEVDELDELDEVDEVDEIRTTDEAGVVKMSEAEVHGQTVIVDSTVTVTIAVALRANSPVARMTLENCILTDGYELRY